MTRHERNLTRQERHEELLATWRQGKRGQAAVLSLCHGALPEGKTLRAGMSIFEVILDHEFSPLATPADAPGDPEAQN